MKHWMKWCEMREYKWNESVTIAVNRNLSNCENSPKRVGELNCYFRSCLNCHSLRWSHTHFISLYCLKNFSYYIHRIQHFCIIRWNLQKNYLYIQERIKRSLHMHYILESTFARILLFLELPFLQGVSIYRENPFPLTSAFKRRRRRAESA